MNVYFPVKELKEAADEIVDEVRPDIVSAEDTVSAPWLRELFLPLREKGTREMVGEGHPAGSLTYRLALDMRYRGQSHELLIRLPEEEGAAVPLADHFHRQHGQRFGYDQPEEIVELVNVRLSVTRPAPPPSLARVPAATDPVAAAVVGRRTVWFEGGPVETLLYDRSLLKNGHQLMGPAVIFQYDTTTVIPPNWQSMVDPFGNLVLNLNP